MSNGRPFGKHQITQFKIIFSIPTSRLISLHLISDSSHTYLLIDCCLPHGQQVGNSADLTGDLMQPQSSHCQLLDLVLECQRLPEGRRE